MATKQCAQCAQCAQGARIGRDSGGRSDDSVQYVESNGDLSVLALDRLNTGIPQQNPDDMRMVVLKPMLALRYRSLAAIVVEERIGCNLMYKLRWQLRRPVGEELYGGGATV